jgi:hypothetical protein
MAGYSGKPLNDKVGLKPGDRVALVAAPPTFPAALAPLPAEVGFVDVGEPFDVGLLFSREAAVLAPTFVEMVGRLRPGGMLWVAWPKRASREPTDLTEDSVRRIGLAAGLVDVKVCAIDEVWSGLKFVRRRAPAGR